MDTSQNEAYSNYRVNLMSVELRLNIGALAKVTGVKIVTIRYYEQVDLMPKPSRTSGNYRTYKHEHVRRLRFIRRCRDLGFTLEQVRELLCLSSHDQQPCAGVDRITAKHLKDIEQKAADLKKLATELRRINRQCPGDGTIATCRILEALSL
jgi:Cu(I)-responsive transcriptional regulator